ncbi:MAG: tRNA(His) guanylyltransferase Thg1 family protein [Polyangiales bacterium]
MDESLAERMKALESAEALRRLPPGTIAVARVDGRSFSRYTRDLARPFDPRLSRLMIETARALTHEAGAVAGYTQSDEITLVMAPVSDEAQVYFDGRIQKMTSQLGAQATAMFHHLLAEHLPEKAAARTLTSLPTFDARVWSVPARADAIDVLRWRQMDGVRNSVLMTAYAEMGHAAMQEKTVRVLRGLLRERGTPWEALPEYFKSGTFLIRRTVRRRFTAEELDALPPKHAARRDPALEVERAELAERTLPDLDGITNLEAVVFEGAEPVRAA